MVRVQGDGARVRGKRKNKGKGKGKGRGCIQGWKSHFLDTGIDTY